MKLDWQRHCRIHHLEGQLALARSIGPPHKTTSPFDSWERKQATGFRNPLIGIRNRLTLAIPLARDYVGTGPSSTWRMVFNSSSWSTGLRKKAATS